MMEPFYEKAITYFQRKLYYKYRIQNKPLYLP